MAMIKTKFKTVDEYFSSYTKDVRNLLGNIREAIKQSAPNAEEIISYNMPAFKFHGILVYYAAHKEHIGFYPGNKIVNEVFKKELKNYETSKGTIKFPFGQKIPTGLIKKIIKFRAKENLEKENARANKGKWFII